MFQVGENLFLGLGGATSPTCLSVTFANFTITQETEKALQLTANGKAFWLPKKALVLKKTPAGLTPLPGCERYELARWFTPNDYQQRVIYSAAQDAHLAIA